MKGKPRSVLVRVSSIVSVVFLTAATGAAAFMAGYSVAFSRLAHTYGQISILKAQARELEAEILHLKNYAVLIDALTTQGQAAAKLLEMPQVSTSKAETGLRQPENQSNDSVRGD